MKRVHICEPPTVAVLKAATPQDSPNKGGSIIAQIPVRDPNSNGISFFNEKGSVSVREK